MRERRKALSAQQLDLSALPALFIKHIAPTQSDIVAIYHPSSGEIPSLPIIETLNQDHIICALPVIQPDSKVLAFHAYAPGDMLSAGPYGIMQPTHHKPVTPTIVIVPLLAFDRSGNRLGQGGGFYDATLAALRRQNANLTVVGLAYDQQECLDRLPVEEHDQKLNWIVTPSRVEKLN